MFAHETNDLAIRSGMYSWIIPRNGNWNIPMNNILRNTVGEPFNHRIFSSATGRPQPSAVTCCLLLSCDISCWLDGGSLARMDSLIHCSGNLSLLPILWGRTISCCLRNRKGDRSRAKLLPLGQLFKWISMTNFRLWLVLLQLLRSRVHGGSNSSSFVCWLHELG